MIEGCIAHFDEEIAVHRQDILGDDTQVVSLELVAAPPSGVDLPLS